MTTPLPSVFWFQRQGRMNGEFNTSVSYFISVLLPYLSVEKKVVLNTTVIVHFVEISLVALW